MRLEIRRLLGVVAVAVRGFGQNRGQRRNITKNEPFNTGNNAEVVLQPVKARITHLSGQRSPGRDYPTPTQSWWEGFETLCVEGRTCSALDCIYSYSLECGEGVKPRLDAWTVTGFEAGGTDKWPQAGNDIRGRWEGARWKITSCTSANQRWGELTDERGTKRAESGGHALVKITRNRAAAGPPRVEGLSSRKVSGSSRTHFRFTRMTRAHPLKAAIK